MEGSFDNWTTRQPLQRSGRDFTIVKLLPPGVYQVLPPHPPPCPHRPAPTASAAAAAAAAAATTEGLTLRLSCLCCIACRFALSASRSYLGAFMTALVWGGEGGLQRCTLPTRVVTKVDTVAL